MATNYNAPNSAYNKDATFAVLNVNEGSRIEFSEAVVKENDDTMTLYAYVTGADKIANFSDKAWTFQPQLCKIKLLKKDSTYNDKTYKPTPAMLIAINAIQGMEGKPFKGFINFAADEWDRAIMLDATVNGASVDPNLKLAVTAKNVGIEPIEKLTELEGKEIPELGGSNGKSWGKGGGGQKELDRLNDKLAFIAEQCKPDSKLSEILKTVDPAQVEVMTKSLCMGWLESLISK